MFTYLMVIAYVMWAVTFLIFICEVVKTIMMFKNGDSGLKKCGSIIIMLITLVAGSAFGILFYQVATMIAH